MVCSAGVGFWMFLGLLWCLFVHWFAPFQWVGGSFLVFCFALSNTAFLLGFPGVYSAFEVILGPYLKTEGVFWMF